MTISRTRRPRRTPRLWQSLEDRVLFDAVVDPAMMDAAAAEEPILPEVEVEQSTTTSDGDQAQAETVRRELVIVDRSVEGYEQLVADLLADQDPERNIDVVLLDADADGIEQVTEQLSQFSELDGLHLVSHGQNGAFRLGGTWINDGTLTADAGRIAAWGDALADHGDILLYGCDIAGNAAGQDLVESLAALTGQQVAASDNDTGAADRGGDWKLEYASGGVETDVAFSAAARSDYAYVLAAGPVVTTSGDQDVMIGESFNFSVTFDNTGADTGFGPYIDLIFPVNGADGAAGTDTPDGIDFTGATYLGQTLNTWEFIFPDDGGGTGEIDHPFWVDGGGVPLTITGTTGDKLVVIELPFGSVTPGQPEIAVDITASVSDLADAGTGLSIQARSGFRFGEDALDNPTPPDNDPSIVSDSQTDVSESGPGWAQQLTITPTLMTLEKSYGGPENETATGPNYVRQYQITVDIADGQTLSNLEIFDSLPNNVVVTSIDSVTVGGSAAAFTDNLASLVFPGNAQDLIVGLNNDVTGTTATNDVVVSFSFYVSEFDADGLRVIPLSGEDDTTIAPDSRSLNQARAVGDWTPIDAVRDAGGTDNAVADPSGVEHTLDDKSIAIQKGVSVVGGGPVVPGAVLEYTLTFQISDYYTLGDLIIDDVFQDGQLFDFGYGAEFDITDFNGNVAGNFSVREIGDADTGQTLVVDQTRIDLLDNASEQAASDGSTALRFDVSAALVAGGAADGVLQGGLSDGPANQGAATGTVRFRTVIQEDYADTFPSTDRSVDQGDVITNNNLTITGSVRQNEEDGSINTISLPAETDTSSASVTIETGTMSKEVFAINGSTTLPTGDNGLPVLVPGDVVTYRVTYTMPTSDFEDLTLTDFFPLPIFNVGDHNADGVFGDTWSFDFDENTLDAVSGTIELGANDDFFPEYFAQTNANPGLAIDTASNQLSILYGNYDDITSTGNTIELYLNVTAQDAPTADGLFLTNIVRASEGTTQLGATRVDDIVQIEVTQPVLELTKGIVATDHPGATFTGSTGPGTITFGGVGSGTLFSGGFITSDGLDTGAIDANVTGLDAGDRVRYAIAVENIGNSARGAFDVTIADTLPSGMTLVAGSLQVVDGTGATVSYVGNEADLFTTGITLDDPSANQGSLAQYSGTTGDNIVLVFFEADVIGNIDANSTLTNTAAVTNFAGQEGGADHTETDLADTATIRISAPTITKTLEGTEINDTNNSDTEAVVGEIVDYEIVITVPEGRMDNLHINDVLDAGLVYLGGSATITASAGLSTTQASFAAVAANPSVTGGGRTVNFDFGTLTNANTVNASAETITITLQAVVANRSQSSAGADLNNTATVTYDGGPNVAASSGNIEVLEPVMTVDIAASTTTADVGNPITFTVTVDNVTHSLGTDAHDVLLEDLLPAGLTYVANSLSHVSGVVPTNLDDSTSLLAVAWSDFDMGTSSVIQFQAITDTSMTPDGLSVPAELQWTSLSGDFTTARSTVSAISTERTGDTSDPGGTLNDYLAADNVAIAFPIAAGKAILGTSETHTADGTADSVADPRLLAIGEIVTYELRTAVGEGTLSNVVFRDLMTDGLALLPGTATLEIISDTPMTVDASLNGANSGVISLPSANVTVTPGATQQIDFDLGNIVNNDNDLGIEELVITFQAIVSNVPANDAGDVLSNGFQFREGGVVRSTSNTVTSEIVEPEIADVNKRVISTNALGTEVTYEVTFSNSGNASAMEVQFTDTMAAELTLDTASINVTSSGSIAGLDTTNSISGLLDVRLGEMAAGASVTVQYTVDVVYAGTPIENEADVSYTSLPGDRGSGSVTPGDSGEIDGERNGSGAVGNDYNDSESAFLGSISDHVFYDVLGDGIDNGDDVGMPGVTVNLRWFGVDGIEGNGDDVIRTTTTDSNGDYVFAALPAGGFRVSVDSGRLPNGITDETFDLDGVGTASTVVTSLTDSLAAIERDDVDFGFTGSAQLGDTVFLDINNNGSQDLNEMGLANVVIDLTWHGFDGIAGNADDIEYSATTNNDGGYNFTLLPAGVYTVDLDNSTAPSGTVVTTGNDSHTLTLVEGQDHDTSDFGLRGPGTIGDFVYFDSNNNGTYDAIVDSPYPNVDVTWSADIDGDGVQETFTTTTDSNGSYGFAGLPLDTFTVTVTGPTGTSPTDDATGPADNQSVVSLTVGTPGRTDQDFGLTGSGSIGDVVYWDHDGSGTQNGGEPGLAGVAVQLTVDLDQDGSDEITLSTTTAADGSYRFDNLPPGAYTVVVTQPAGTTQTVDADGLGTANESTMILAAGQTRDDQDFGYNGTGSIGDLVYFDYVGDGGPFNSGENDRGMGGVDVTLHVDVNGDSVSDFSLTTTTAADGSYQFDSLVAGDYTITVDPSSLPDLMGANPTFDADGIGTANASELTLAAGASNGLQDFGYHAVPDYNITIDDGNLAVQTGESLVYTVTVRNDGTLRGNNAVVTVAFPPNLLEAVAASTGGIVDSVAGTVTWNSVTLPDLAVMNVGEEVVFTIDADVVSRLDGSYLPITMTADVSDDLVNGIDPDLSDNTNDDVDHIPEIGVAKRLVSSTSAAIGGNRELTYEVVVRNLGSLDLTDLSLFEDLDDQFGVAFAGVVPAPTIVASTASTDPDFASGAATWDGDSNTNLFDGVSGLLSPGQEYTVRFTVEVDIDQLGPGSNNQVTGVGEWDVLGLEIGTISDLSDTGIDPDGTNPGVPGDSGGYDDPTLIPAIGIAKDHGDNTEVLDGDGNGTGVFSVPTTLVVENLGATDLTDLNLRDDIASIYGSAFVSVSNLSIDASGVIGSTAITPSVNSGWESDTTLNMLSSGFLNPGDTFTVTFDVVLNPDSGGQSGYMDNQATIIGSDPSNPTAIVQDLSDSGLDPATNNTGEPGDLATADDPTPIAIPDIGLAKSVVAIKQRGLAYELTLQLVLENTGTVDLENIRLEDDIAAQYDANFGGILRTPVITGSTATATPTVNAAFAGDTTQPIFDGSDGFLKPGETVTLHIVVKVVSEPGQTEITVINQAGASADPLDANGNPLLNDAGNPIARVTDDSDSGADATGSNPGAPGNTGSWDDPTPQKLTFFTFDSFNDFSQGRKSQQLFGNRDPSDPFDVGRRPEEHRHRILTQEISSLAPEPIFSGSARPGTQIIGRVFDSAGRLIGEEIAFADVGGNWMMQFHSPESRDHGRFEFIEVAGNSSLFDSKGDIYGYLGTDSLNNDYASLEPWTSYDRTYEFTANYRPTIRQSLMQQHQQVTKPIGFGR